MPSASIPPFGRVTEHGSRLVFAMMVTRYRNWEKGVRPCRFHVGKNIWAKGRREAVAGGTTWVGPMPQKKNLWKAYKKAGETDPDFTGALVKGLSLSEEGCAYVRVGNMPKRQ